jgi:leader peptidase (prepilin peptidase)/N-methyltransferase
MQIDWLVIRMIAALAGLIVLSAEDLIRKEISLIPVGVMALVGVICSVLAGEWTGIYVLLQFLPGVLVLIFAKISRECIGYGDGWVLLSLGCFLSVDDLAGLCMVSLTCAGMVALFMLLVKRRGRRTQMPFVPFLLIGYVVIRLTAGYGE